jgi:hypothetical protein
LYVAVAGPAMKMYFFTDMPFYLLFQNWVPSNSGELAGAWFAIFFLGMVYELMIALKHGVEMKWALESCQLDQVGAGW